MYTWSKGCRNIIYQYSGYKSIFVKRISVCIGVYFTIFMYLCDLNELTETISHLYSALYLFCILYVFVRLLSVNYMILCHVEARLTEHRLRNYKAIATTKNCNNQSMFEVWQESTCYHHYMGKRLPSNSAIDTQCRLLYFFSYIFTIIESTSITVTQTIWQIIIYPGHQLYMARYGHNQ